MSGFLGCFVVLFPSSSLRSRAVDYAELEDEEQLIASGSSGITSLVSHGDTVTSASSLRGIGTLSGKAIMAVGNVLIRGIEVVDIQRRLRRITTQLGKSDADLSPEALEDLFELQRDGLYPKKVRRRAMQLVVLVMCRRRSFEQLVQALQCQPVEEVRLFLEQLCCLDFSNEKLVPGLIAQISEEDNLIYQEKQHSTLSDRFCELVVALLKKHPSLLLDAEESGPLFEVVLFLFKSGRTEMIVSEWEDEYVQRFVRKLNLFRLAGWSANVRVGDYPFLEAAVQGGAGEPLSRDRATDAFCEVISDILESRSTLLCGTLPIEETVEIVSMLFARRHFRSVISTLLACSSECVRYCLFRLAKGEQSSPRQPGFLVDIVNDTEIAARAERQANFSDLLRRIMDWHPHFLHEVFSVEQFTILIITAVDDPSIPADWSHTHLLMYHFAMRGSLSPLRSCFMRFIEPPRQ